MDKWKADTGWTSIFGLKRLTKILTAAILLIVMIMSSVGMMTAETSWGDTLFTCVWCLTLVMITDRIEKI
mgnify:CR=1 FL=1